MIKIIVNGLPPKKDGANSMWNKDLEADRLISLRNEALNKIINKPLKKNLQLNLKIYLKINNKSQGDLDNFITGICDGLMRAHDRAEISPKFNGFPKINPQSVNFIEDDYKILNINAKKIINRNLEKEYYELEIIEI
ncbi:MAG: hypothetical protein Q8N99_00265 [Nanoarchaeota archaeon]|nr:hypothetical protein [Nanoarchaeota archaeon]